MFFLNQNRDVESKAPLLTDLSLSIGAQEAEKSHSSSHIPKELQFISFSSSRDRTSPNELPESLTKIKRQRSMDGEALTLGTGAGLRKPEVKIVVDHHSTGVMRCTSFGDGNGVYEGTKYSKSQPFPVGNVSNVGSAGGGRAAGKVGPYQPHLVHWLNRENGNRKSGRARAGATCRSMPVSDKIRCRMIKNRESAARSRARKQAQEAELQHENVALGKENDLLKRVVRHLLAILRTKHMKSPTLSRSFSAPI